MPQRDAGGRLIRYLWELVHLNGEQIAQDFAAGSVAFRSAKGRLFAERKATLIGPAERLFVDPRREGRAAGRRRHHGRAGGHRAGGGGRRAFTRLEGPCYIGPGTQVLGAKVRAGTTLGPNCRIGGEVEASIVQGHSNKYHDGFLGHAYVGEWVNLGAGTQQQRPAQRLRRGDRDGQRPAGADGA